MNKDSVNDLLFECIRAGLGIGPSPEYLSEDDCGLLVALANKQSVSPIVWRGIKKLGLENKYIDELKQHCDTDIFKSVLRNKLINKVRSAFDGADIKYIVLKGADICKLYPEAWMRTSTDVDILISEDDYKRGCTLLTEQYGFTAGAETDHDISLSGCGANLELHYKLCGESDPYANELSNVWSNCTSTGSGSEYDMNAEFKVFYILSHMCRHFVKQGLGIRSFIDLYLIDKKTEYDSDKVKALCEKTGIEEFRRASFELCCVWFECSEHSELTRRIEKYCFSGGVFGNAENAFYAERRVHKNKAGFFFRRLFLKKEDLQRYYPEIKDKRGPLLRYQIKRWFAASKNKKGVAKRDISIMASEKNQKMADFNELMDMLKL